MRIKDTEVTWAAPDGKVLTTLHEIFCAWYGSENPWVARMKITPLVEHGLLARGYKKQIVPMERQS